LGDASENASHDNNGMLTQVSKEIADVVATAAPSVVQVQGRRRPASGLVYANDVVVTTVHALGGEDGLQVRRDDGRRFEAELAGWDPTTRLAVLRVAAFGVPPIVPTTIETRIGHLAVAIARSWSNAVTASAGLVARIGGPLPTSRHRMIDQVIRTTAPMHSGFAGGALIDTTGQLIGVTTAATIRGLGVVIPTAIAWKTVASVLQHGRPQRGYLGVIAQSVTLPDHQRGAEGSAEALLVTGLPSGSPAAAGGVLVGDLLLAFDGRSVGSPEDLLDLLLGTSIGHSASLRVRRGGSTMDVTVTIGSRPIFKGGPQSQG
jgi:S1-C subfamily serine protease